MSAVRTPAIENATDPTTQSSTLTRAKIADVLRVDRDGIQRPEYVEVWFVSPVLVRCHARRPHAAIEIDFWRDTGRERCSPAKANRATARPATEQETADFRDGKHPADAAKDRDAAAAAGNEEDVESEGEE